MLAKHSRYSCTNVREVHEMRTIYGGRTYAHRHYTVRKLHDNIVAMGLRFCLHEVVAKNRDQVATFF